MNTCYGVTAAWQGKITSLGPDDGDFMCDLYSSWTNNSTDMVFLEVEDLMEMGWGTGDSANPVSGIWYFGVEGPEG
jgi:hypothetical protein